MRWWWWEFGIVLTVLRQPFNQVNNPRRKQKRTIVSTFICTFCHNNENFVCSKYGQKNECECVCAVRSSHLSQSPSSIGSIYLNCIFYVLKTSVHARIVKMLAVTRVLISLFSFHIFSMSIFFWRGFFVCVCVQWRILLAFHHTVVGRCNNNNFSQQTHLHSHSITLYSSPCWMEVMMGWWRALNTHRMRLYFYYICTLDLNSIIFCSKSSPLQRLVIINSVFVH